MKVGAAAGVEQKEEAQPRVALFVGAKSKPAEYQFPQVPDGVTVKGDGKYNIAPEALEDLGVCDVALVYAHSDVEGREDTATEIATMDIIEGFKYTIDAVRAINAKTHPKHWDIVGCYAGAFYHDIEREIKAHPETFPVGTTFSLLSSSKHTASDTGCIDYVQRRLQEYQSGRSDYPSLFAEESLKTAETQFFIKVVEGGIIAFKAIAPKNVEDVANLEAFLRKDAIYAHPGKSHQRSHLIAMAGMDHPEYKTIHDEIMQSMNQDIDSMKIADGSKLDPEKTIDYRFRALHLNSKFNLKPELAQQWIRQDTIDKNEKQTLLIHKLIGSVKNPPLLRDCAHGLEHSLEDIGQSADALDINARDINGSTVLHLASAIDMQEWHRNDNVLKYAGNSVAGVEEWESQHVGIIKTLLEMQDIDVNLQNDSGNTPAHLAAEALNDRCLRMLIKKGARLDVLNHDGKTPLQVFKEKYAHGQPLAPDQVMLDKAKKVVGESKDGKSACMEIKLFSRTKEVINPSSDAEDMTLEQARTIIKDYIRASKIESIRNQLVPPQEQARAAEQPSAAAVSVSQETRRKDIFSPKIKLEELNKPSVKELAKLFGGSVSQQTAVAVASKEDLVDAVDVLKVNALRKPASMHAAHLTQSLDLPQLVSQNPQSQAEQFQSEARQFEHPELNLDIMNLQGLVVAPGEGVSRVDAAQSTPKIQSPIASRSPSRTQ